MKQSDFEKQCEVVGPHRPATLAPSARRPGPSEEDFAATCVEVEPEPEPPRVNLGAVAAMLATHRRADPLVPKNQANVRWEGILAGDGTPGWWDATLLFGKNKGQTVSTLVSTDPDYLKWVLKQSFPEDLKAIIRLRLGFAGQWP